MIPFVPPPPTILMSHMDPLGGEIAASLLFGASEADVWSRAEVIVPVNSLSAAMCAVRGAHGQGSD